MKVLVTGAAGCLGRATRARLAARGHAWRGLDLAAGDGDWVRGDLLAADLGFALAGCDAVVHLAALVHRPEITDPAVYERANVAATRRLLDAAAAAGVAAGRVAFASTVGVYGRDHDLHADEETATAPRTPYAQTKLRAEALVREHGGVVLRFPVLYGPGDRGNVAQLARAIARGRFALPGACDRPRSLVAAENAAEGLTLALERGRAGRVYLVTDGEDLTVRRLAETIGAAVGVGVPTAPYAIVWAAAAAGSAAAAVGLRVPVTLDALRKLTTRLTFSCARARVELDYRPAVDPAAALHAAALDGRHEDATSLFKA